MVGEDLSNRMKRKVNALLVLIYHVHNETNHIYGHPIPIFQEFQAKHNQDNVISSLHPHYGVIPNLNDMPPV